MIPVQTLSTRLRKESDPLQLFRLFCQDGHQANSLLFETADSTDGQMAKSILVTQSALKIELKESKFTITALSLNGQSLLEKISTLFSGYSDFNQNENQISFRFSGEPRLADPLAELRSPSVLDVLRCLQNEIEPDAQFAKDFLFCSVFAYDLIDYFEQLPAGEDELNFPDLLIYVPEQLLRIDHQSQLITLFHFVFADSQSSPLVQDSLLEFNAAIDVITTYKLQTDPDPQTDSFLPQFNDLISDDVYKQMIIRAKEAIRAGDVYQIVPSRCFSMACVSAIEAYRKLRRSNPSPYMFYIQADEFTLFGASPETAVKFDQSSRRVSLNPIAGTKPRALTAIGKIDADQDNRNEMDLLLNHKEIAEHIMLLDLARNDIAKISRPNTRRVSRMMQVEKYSHVMHLVSEVEGILADDLDALHAYQSCANMGTLTGSPKIKAAQLLRKLENQKRGPYGGAVGYLNCHGDLDTCITIRSTLVINQIAYIQSGAGIVLDSVPADEVAETRQKAAAVIQSLVAEELIV